MYQSGGQKVYHLKQLKIRRKKSEETAVGNLF
jgi:hypothetical protein